MTVTTDAETIVRRAYYAAEGNVMDVQGFIDLFADDGVFNAVGQQSFRGEHLGDPVVFMGKLAIGIHPDYASAVKAQTLAQKATAQSRRWISRILQW
jgi:hypothetical protein